MRRVLIAACRTSLQALCVRHFIAIYFCGQTLLACSRGSCDLCAIPTDGCERQDKSSSACCITEKKSYVCHSCPHVAACYTRTVVFHFAHHMCAAFQRSIFLGTLLAFSVTCAFTRTKVERAACLLQKVKIGRTTRRAR